MKKPSPKVTAKGRIEKLKFRVAVLTQRLEYLEQKFKEFEDGQSSKD